MAHFREMGGCVVTGSNYLLGFIGDQESDKVWLNEKVSGWADLVEVLTGVVCRHPQIAYAHLQKFLQKD